MSEICTSCNRPRSIHQHSEKKRDEDRHKPVTMRDGFNEKGELRTKEEPWKRIKCSPAVAFNPGLSTGPGRKTNIGDPLQGTSFKKKKEEK